MTSRDNPVFVENDTATTMSVAGWELLGELEGDNEGELVDPGWTSAHDPLRVQQHTLRT